MTRQTKAIYINLTGDGVPTDQKDEPGPRERDTEDTLQAFLDEFGPQSAKLSLYRLKTGTAKYDWLAHYVPDNVTPETIRSEWGAGTYALNLLDERGHYISRRIFDIGGTAEDWERARITSGQRASALAGGTESNDNGDMIKLQLQMMQQQHETLIALIGNKSGGLEDVVKVFAALKDTAKPTDQLETLAAMLKLSREMSGGNDSLIGLIKDVAPAVIEPLGKALSGVAAAARNGNGTLPNAKAVPELPAPREIPPPEAKKEPSSLPGDDVAGDTEEVTRLLYAQLQYWKGKARAGRDPDFWIDYVFENDDEPNIKAVLWAARHHDFNTLLQFDPEIAADERLREWFRQVYETIRAELFKRDDSAGQHGDTADASANAGADSGGGDGTGDAGNDSVPAETASAVEPAGSTPGG